MSHQNDIEFRVPEPSDALCVGMLATQVFLDTYATDGLRPDLAREALNNYGPAAFEARIRDSLNHFLLAECAGHLLAFSECRLSSNPPMPSLAQGVELVRLYVQRHYQRTGMGAALLDRAEAHARRNGARVLWLTAWLGNTNAREFYLARGYDDVGGTSYVFEGQAYEDRIYGKVLQNAPQPHQSS